MLRPNARLLASLLVTGTLLWHGTAQATDCEPSSGISSCFDADNLWVSAGRTPFVGIAPASVAAPEQLSAATSLSYLSRPIQLNAPSPDPDGRDIRVIDEAINWTLAWAYAPSELWELTLATPLTLWQSGAGAEGVTSQDAPPVVSTAIHDPRVGVGFALPLPSAARRTGLAAKARVELGLPLGDEQLYAGERSVVAAPSIALGLELGRLRAGAELGARLRRSVPFATAELGSQLVSSFGLSFDVISEERLSLVAESYVMPVLVSQPGRTSGAERVRDGILAPAEWLASVRSAPFSDHDLSLQLGGGTGIPLSSEVREGPNGSETDHFAGVTTPRFRLVFAARYTPR